ncbi:MAG TPA: hypothetical protein VMS56_03585 [Thermoanaerobaculia bacterium]|nr:hypothetical protein [Thermoanaerobaculia bacterium]
MRHLASFLLLLSLSSSAAAGVAGYEAVRSSRPDGRSIAVSGLILERDAYRIELRSRTIHLLAPFGEETFGAVFLGHGSFRLAPALPSERLAE